MITKLEFDGYLSPTRYLTLYQSQISILYYSIEMCDINTPWLISDTLIKENNLENIKRL